jgi:hypothetical protein
MGRRTKQTLTDAKAFKYIIVSPVRHEGKFIGNPPRAIIVQSVKPVEWVLANDGSTDGTVSITDRYVPGEDYFGRYFDRFLREACLGVGAGTSVCPSDAGFPNDFGYRSLSRALIKISIIIVS